MITSKSVRIRHNIMFLYFISKHESTIDKKYFVE